MKKKLQTVLFIGLLILGTNVFSQAKLVEAAEVKTGKRTTATYLNLMINVVSTNFNYGASNSALTDYKKSAEGIQAGVSFQAGITPGFSLVSEFYFMRKGGKLKVNNPLNIAESSIRLNSLELPVLARFHVGKFYMNAGPSIAYNLNGDNKLNEISTKLSFKKSGGSYKRFDGGIQAGGGVEFPFKQKRIALDIRYNHGLTNIAYSKEMYNRSVMISVHFSRAWRTNPLSKNSIHRN